MKNKINIKILKYLGIFLSICILCFMVKEFTKNWISIKPYLSQMNVLMFIFSIFIYASAFLFVGYNWSYLLWRMDSKNSIVEYLNIHMTSALARYLPGGIWNIVGKAVMCKNIGVENSRTTVSMILEYVFQIVSSTLFFVFFIPVLLRTHVNVSLLLTFLGLCLVVALYFMPKLITLGAKMLSKFLKEDCSSIKFSRKYVYNVLFRFILAWLVTGVGIIVLAKSFTDISNLQGLYLILSYPISWVVGFLSPSPNGMGVREGVLGYFLGLSKNGYSYELILLITLTTRVWTMLGEALAFIVYKGFYFIHKTKRFKYGKIT